MTYEIIHGDCLDVLRTMDDASVDAIVTDPPYGISYQSARRTGSERMPKIANDGAPFVWWLHDAARVLKEGGHLICFCRYDVQEAFRLAIIWAGLTVKSQIVWDRVIHGLGDLSGAFAPQHDVAWHASKGRATLVGGRPQSVIRVQRPNVDDMVHPTEKPAELMQRIISHVSLRGGVVLDPFSGSGSTGIACMRLGRNFIGIEREADYCDIARKRIAAAAAQGNLFHEVVA